MMLLSWVLSGKTTVKAKNLIKSSPLQIRNVFQTYCEIITAQINKLSERHKIIQLQLIYIKT